MIKNKNFGEYGENSVSYLIEGENVYNRTKAIECLKMVKERESKQEILPVWVDSQTTKLIDKRKVLNKKIELLKVRVNGRIVWIERDNAIKNGFINE